MNYTSGRLSNMDEVSRRGLALAKVYELLIKLSDQSETNLPATTPDILEEQDFEVTLNPSAELDTEELAEIQPA